MTALPPRRLSWIFAAAAGLVALVAVALPFVASTRLVSDRIADEMSRWSGLEVSIGSASDISVWPDLQANFTDVTLTVPGGGAVVRAERVEVELSALAALGGQVEFSSTHFFGPTILVSLDDAPRTLPNSRISRALAVARDIVAENRTAPDTARLPADDFGTVAFSDARIVRTFGSAEVEIASGVDGKLTWERLNGRASASASGSVLGEPFSIELSSASPLLLFGGAETPVTARLMSAPVNLSFDGRASLGENPYAEGKASFAAPSVRQLFDWPYSAPLPGPAIDAISVESHVMGDLTRVRFEDAVLTMDGNPARGALDLILAGELPKVSGTLAFDTLDLISFLSAFTPLDTSGDGGPGVMSADFAGRLDLDLRLSAAQAEVGSFKLANVAATARVDEGLAAFDISDASAFDGNIQAGLRFDQEDAAAVEMRLLASNVNGGAFSAAAGMTSLAPSGRGTVSVILKGHGKSWDTLMTHANGSFSANFGAGTLSGIDLARLVAQVQTGDRFPLDTTAKAGSPIDGLEVKVVVADGTAKFEKAEIRTPQQRISFTGTAPLSGGAVSLSATAEPPPKGADAVADPAAATTFLIDGPWNAATVTPQRIGAASE